MSSYLLLSRMARLPLPSFLFPTALLVVCGCGARQPTATTTPAGPTAARILPLARVIVLETSGPPPPDTSVTFTTGAPRTIVLTHGPPENIEFASVSFAAHAFADSGQTVTVDIKPRPGVYGVDLATTLPFRSSEASLVFDYARYFSAPAHALQVYHSHAGFERALAVGRVLPDNQIELLPSTHPEPDDIEAALPVAGSYLAAAPQ
jgi:hypothetical protein